MDLRTMLAYASDEDGERKEKRTDQRSSRDKDKEQSKKKPLAPDSPSSERDSEPASEENSGGG